MTAPLPALWLQMQQQRDGCLGTRRTALRREERQAMLQKVVFGGGSWERAKASLDAGALRQKVIASNIANAATPGYKAKEVAFEEMLKAEASRLPLDRRDERHIGSSAVSTPKPQVRLRGGDPAAGGVNDVSIEAELTELTQNTLHFQSVAQLLANRYRGVRDAIRPG